MKKSLLSLLSWLLVLAMLVGALAACDGNEETSTNDGTKTPVENTTGDESDVENTTDESETVTEDETEKAQLDGDYAEQITSANKLANGVQASFTDAKRTHFTLTNTEMLLNYSRSADNENGQLVESIKNTKGASYIENTMDVYIKMNDGSTFYTSSSGKSAEVNLYRFGFYYYQALFEFQNFVPASIDIENTVEIRARRFTEKLLNDMDFTAADNGGAQFTINAADDPFVTYSKLSYPTEDFDVLEVTMKGVGDTKGGVIYYSVNGKALNNNDKLTFTLANDGEMHTYIFPLFTLQGYEGDLNVIRFDPSGSVGDGLVIESIRLGKAAGLESVPQYVSTNRHFHVYSDKMHHAVQFATTQTTENVSEVGMVTRIDASTVDKILVKTTDAQFTSLDESIDWTQVESVGFDIKDAGIFGYIMPVDAVAGNIKVTLEDGTYVITQWRVPENNTLVPSVANSKNANDFYIGQRVYTDENHDFDEFLHETYCERNPLTEKDIRVNTAVSDNGELRGYDAVRGVYVLNIGAPTGGFSTPYAVPNKNYKVNFSIRSKEVDRSIYVTTYTSQFILECAALMSEDMLMLPMPIEVIKNFSETNGERNLFNIDDPTFSEAIFYLSLEKDEIYEYNILNLYQNWGKYPLKQLSQIPYHCPYYHLSTGVTETNCITPYFSTATTGKAGLDTLPDFRSMSAPLWSDQPQHNSCGTHYWLQYTGEDGRFIATENYNDNIDSFGPTYAEVVMSNISDDGKIAVTYTHMEMPQTDENRTYYTMEYEFLEDLTIKDLKHNFQFYSVTDNDSLGYYTKVGYLNEENRSVVVSAASGSDTAEYVLGDECPYFSFFDMPVWKSDTGYSNVAFLVYSSEFIIGGEKAEPRFFISNSNNTVRLSLNLDDVTFKAGDKITINCILLPWGSQESVYDGTNGLAPDQNVRDVRENTLLDPLTVTSETDEIIESAYLPRVKSADGKSATFTLSGGENNVTVRVYGFDMLTAPKVEELIDGEWKTYVLDSSETPDKVGYFHYYDGYSVYYDGDGTYSYSFVTTMTDGESRTFRLRADEEFVEWPGREFVLVEAPNLLDVYLDDQELYDKLLNSSRFGKSVKCDGYTEVYPNTESAPGEAYVSVFSNSSETYETGNFLVVKYRVPSTNSEKIGNFEFWSSTTIKTPTAGNYFSFSPISDGEWHVAVIDLSLVSALPNFSAASDGKYYAQHLRFDIFNRKFTDPTTHIDIAYVGIDASLEEICAINKDQFETIILYENGLPIEVNTETCEKLIKTYLDPVSGFVETSVPYASAINYICGVAKTLNTSSLTAINVYKGATVNRDYQVSIRGWCVADGGIAKYVYSVDSGKTWHDIVTTVTYDAKDDILSAAAQRLGYKDSDWTKFYSSVEASRKNGAFQNSPLAIDLSAYEGQTVDVIIAAVPEADQNSLALLCCLEGVVCTVESIFDEASIYGEANNPFGAQIDTINAITIGSSGSAAGFKTITTTLHANDSNCLNIVGWATVDSGVSKYVWTADNGATWHDCIGDPGTITSDSMISLGAKRAGLEAFEDVEAAKVGGLFQSSATRLSIDLSEFAGESEPLTIIFAAVPQNQTQKVCILYRFECVSMIPAEEATE